LQGFLYRGIFNRSGFMPVKTKTLGDAELEAFAEWLRSARKSRGFTQSDLSEASGVDQALISKYERRLLPCPKSSVYSLAEVLAGPDSDDGVKRRTLNTGLLAAGFAPLQGPNEKTGPIETILHEAGYSSDALDDDAREQLRQSMDAMVIGMVEQEKRKGGRA